MSCLDDECFYDDDEYDQQEDCTPRTKTLYKNDRSRSQRKRHSSRSTYTGKARRQLKLPKIDIFDKSSEYVNNGNEQPVDDEWTTSSDSDSTDCLDGNQICHNSAEVEVDDMDLLVETNRKDSQIDEHVKPILVDKSVLTEHATVEDKSVETMKEVFISRGVVTDPYQVDVETETLAALYTDKEMLTEEFQTMDQPTQTDPCIKVNIGVSTRISARSLSSTACQFIALSGWDEESEKSGVSIYSEEAAEMDTSGFQSGCVDQTSTVENFEAQSSESYVYAYVDKDLTQYSKLRNSQLRDGRLMRWSTAELKKGVFVVETEKSQMVETYPQVFMSRFLVRNNRVESLVTEVSFIIIEPDTLIPFEKPPTSRMMLLVLEGHIIIKSSGLHKEGSCGNSVFIDEWYIEEEGLAVLQPGAPFSIENRTSKRAHINIYKLNETC